MKNKFPDYQISNNHEEAQINVMTWQILLTK